MKKPYAETASHQIHFVTSPLLLPCESFTIANLRTPALGSLIFLIRFDRPKTIFIIVLIKIA